MGTTRHTKSRGLLILFLFILLKTSLDNGLLNIPVAALAQVPIPIVTNILKYPSPYILHTPLPGSISNVVYNNLEFLQSLVRKDDPAQPQWGDGIGGKLRKRAQIVPLLRTPIGTIKTINLQFFVPNDWKTNEWPIAIAGGHSVNLKAGPWTLYIKGEKIQFTLSVDNPNGDHPNEVNDIFDVVNEKFPLILDHLYEFRMVMFVAKDMTGYAQVFIDGKMVVDYKGPTVSTNESGLPYEKFGLYVFSRNTEWPFPDQDYKRILMRIF